MKRMLRAVLPLLLCLSLCLILFPCAFAEGGSDTSVRFYNAKGYDLIGLHVYHESLMILKRLPSLSAALPWRFRSH